MSSHGQGEPASNRFLLAHVSTAEILESSAVFCVPQPQNLRIPTSICSTHTYLYIKKIIYGITHVSTHLHGLPCTCMWDYGKPHVKIPRQHGGEAGVMPLPLMQFTSSPDPSRSDLLQELIKIPLKNNCKMKQIALSGGQ